MEKIKNLTIKQWISFGFLIWYLYMYLYYPFDTAVSIGVRTAGGVTILLSIFLTISNIKPNEYKLLYRFSVTVLLLWYLFYTPIDITVPGYSLREKIVYGFIDIGFIFYLFVYCINYEYFKNKTLEYYAISKKIVHLFNFEGCVFISLLFIYVYTSIIGLLEVWAVLMAKSYDGWLLAGLTTTALGLIGVSRLEAIVKSGTIGFIFNVLVVLAFTTNAVWDLVVDLNHFYLALGSVIFSFFMMAFSIIAQAVHHSNFKKL